MKNDILSDLYFGNITPTNRQIVHGSEVDKAAAELSDAENKLHNMLDSQALAQLERLIKAQLTLNAIIAKESYIDGFKTGARFMLAVFDDISTEFESLGK